MKTERWKNIEDFPGYQVSSLGRIRNKHGRILRTCMVSGGLSLILRKDGFGQGARVARIVGKTFSKAYRDDRYPIYRDGDRTNCALGNLKWVPRGEVTGVPYSKQNQGEQP